MSHDNGNFSSQEVAAARRKKLDTYGSPHIGSLPERTVCQPGIARRIGLRDYVKQHFTDLTTARANHISFFVL